MTTLIFGKNSQVGKELLNFTVNLKTDCIFYDSKDLNFNNSDQIEYVLNKIKPDIIVNLAAYTDVDASEALVVAVVADDAALVADEAAAVADDAAAVAEVAADVADVAAETASTNNSK